MRVLFKTSSKNHEVQLLLKWLKTEDMQNSDVYLKVKCTWRIEVIMTRKWNKSDYIENLVKPPYDDKWSIYKIWLLREKEQWPNMGRL